MTSYRAIKPIEISAFSLTFSVNLGNRFNYFIESGLTNEKLCFVKEVDGIFISGIFFCQNPELLNEYVLFFSTQIKDDLSNLLAIALLKMQAYGAKRIETIIEYEDLEIIKILENRKFFEFQNKLRLKFINKTKNLAFRHFDWIKLNSKSDFVEVLNRVFFQSLDSEDYFFSKKSKNPGLEYFDFLQSTTNNTNNWFIIKESKETVGVVILNSVNTENFILDYIGIVPQFRGRGYIKYLLKDVILYCEKSHVIFAETDNKNFPMKDAFLNAGFEISSNYLQFIWER